ncbi:MAG: hypothetical protein IJP71_03850 [Lachnospiraceae bacterium]|nr:hypothetical protein [Lachnospiraceae bacterium]
MDKKKRLKELNDFVGKDKVIFLQPLINDIIFMEERAEKLKKLPFIKVNKNNLEVQKRTEASKLYLSLMAQYTQDVKALSFLAGKSSDEEEVSPLRLYLQKLNNKGE